MKQIAVTIPLPIETHQLPMDKFSLKALGLDVPENANKGFILTKNGRDRIIILGKAVCDRLTLDHRLLLNSQYVDSGWGYGMDVHIDQNGHFCFNSSLLTHIRISLMSNPTPYEIKEAKVQIQKAITAQGLFQIEVEQIIEEADYDPRPNQDNADEDDDEEDYDDDEPF